MVKKMTLTEVGQMLTHVVKHMATKEDIQELRDEMATKSELKNLADKVKDLGDEMHMKLDGINRCLDTEAMERREQNLPARVTRVEKHLSMSSHA